MRHVGDFAAVFAHDDTNLTIEKSSLRIRGKERQMEFAKFTEANRVSLACFFLLDLLVSRVGQQG